MRTLIILSTIALASCESSTAVMGASEKGLGALSCGEIQNVFGAFERDRNSVAAAKQLGLAINLPYTAGTDLGGYYELAKTTANVALMAQGCTPLGQ